MKIFIILTALMSLSHIHAEESGKSTLNHLANEKSPYLQQHATNPVDWYPWGEDFTSNLPTTDPEKLRDLIKQK